MLIGLVLAVAVAGWVPPLPALLTALVWTEPLAALPVVLFGAAKAWSGRRRSARSELMAAWLRSIAGELRAGRSLRMALVGASRSVPELALDGVARLAEAGRPLEEVAQAMAALPGMGSAAAILVAAGRTGGSVVPVLDVLAGEATDESVLDRELRSSTVQARLSVAIVGGFPLAVLATQLAGGELGRLLARGPVGVGIVLVGTGLLLSGLGAVAFLLRRAAPS
ncbi:MAG: type II secretion system F family protein [Actinomycetota bacterium]